MTIAQKYNIGVATATQWVITDTSTDKSHCPDKQRTNLTELQGYPMCYNHHILQNNLGHVSHMTKLREWQKNTPDLLIINLDNQSNLDITKITQPSATP
ncbi:MAG: hypothetical protein IE928_01080 [Gammaproteobacteria bacterium]|nr:hypothetical protein [Gammaproteobacteria bacterium]